MTFSLVLRDPETGEFGSAISSSSPAVAARCVNLLDGVGGAHSQNVTDPRLGPKILAEMQTGASAQEAIDRVVAAADQDTIGLRQLLAVDSDGTAGAYTGPNALGTFGHRLGDGVAAGGNMLKTLDVLDAMIEAATQHSGGIEERLLAALKAAVARGGEEGPVHSAGIAVVGTAGWRITDLRVDWSEHDPIAELERALGVWMPQREDYITRGLNPAAAPSYGVPGDE